METKNKLMKIVHIRVCYHTYNYWQKYNGMLIKLELPVLLNNELIKLH